MNSTICTRCRMALRGSKLSAPSFRFPPSPTLVARRAKSDASWFPDPNETPIEPPLPPAEHHLDAAALLSKPTWSVRSLLPPSANDTSTRTTTSTENSTETEPEPITSKTLRHLLRLSALPAPSSPEEEASMLSTLRSQLHFVRAIQSVDTTGVEPLRAIRDETAEGRREQTIGLDTLKDALASEDVVGHARRPRRRRGGKVDAAEVEGWDVLGGAEMTAGRYFVVRSGSEKSP
ncbi:uncharacterized protein BCR38DRAFT_485526 [Pseudomassariella vexata]|uniref:Glutamyl-tRNA amidotransferase complex subunit Gta3 domain-containing protein n=1 Tax=Pseudomassariella vexata TaxID=1141098 RepID=A0A1Y2DYQ4_9PEZI|nr:uncharacterized protein BCR38DRAFT_485526 [Pseudomassariella vexata]ORY64367.1 hypothetical protein BCR38DRAFT_485526 [Pseudomassariella vexata]